MAIKEVLGKLGSGAKVAARKAGTSVANNIAQNKQNNEENGIGKKIKDKAAQAAKAVIKLIWKLLPFFVKIIIIVVIFVILMGIGIVQYIKQVFSSEGQVVGTDATTEEIREIYESQGIDLEDLGLGKLDEDGKMLLQKYLNMEYIKVEGASDNKDYDSKNKIEFDGDSGSVGHGEQTETIENRDYKAKEDTKDIDIDIRTISINSQEKHYESNIMGIGNKKETSYRKASDGESQTYNVSLNNIINQYMVKSQLLTAVYLSSQNADFTEDFINEIIGDGTKVTLKEYHYLIYDKGFVNIGDEGASWQNIVDETDATIYLIEKVETWFGTFKFKNNVSLEIRGKSYSEPLDDKGMIALSYGQTNSTISVELEKEEVNKEKGDKLMELLTKHGVNKKEFFQWLVELMQDDTDTNSLLTLKYLKKICEGKWDLKIPSSAENYNLTLSNSSSWDAIVQSMISSGDAANTLRQQSPIYNFSGSGIGGVGIYAEGDYIVDTTKSSTNIVLSKDQVKDAIEKTYSRTS